METAIVPVTNNAMPIMEVAAAADRFKLLNSFIGATLRENVDYGKIPGAGEKRVLLKAGAEKLNTYFGHQVTFEAVRIVEDWTGKDYDGEPFFYYLMKCRLLRQGQIVAEGDGSCNSRESKYRYRKAERVCPTCGQPAIIKGKAEYGGGWLCYKNKGGCGAKFGDKDSAIVNQEVGRIINPDIADQVNTILKMAEKRALIAATLIAVNASDYFTQDIEDMPGYGEIVEASYRYVDADTGEISNAKTTQAASTPTTSTASASKTASTPAPDAPRCPKCGGEMLDQREKRAKAQAEGKAKPPPAWKCKAGSWTQESGQIGCDGKIWPSDPNEEGGKEKPVKASDAAIGEVIRLSTAYYGTNNVGATMKDWLARLNVTGAKSLKDGLLKLTPDQIDEMIASLRGEIEKAQADAGAEVAGWDTPAEQ
jgi:ssDNA-binding Zn-finger/Zn-ribbon topoisomerase 1